MRKLSTVMVTNKPVAKLSKRRITELDSLLLMGYVTYSYTVNRRGRLNVTSKLTASGWRASAKALGAGVDFIVCNHPYIRRVFG